MDFLLVTCLIVVVGCFLQAALMFLHAWEHRRFHASRWQSPIPSDAGLRVTLFVPCRGTDLEMESNLRALFLQRDVQYELCFIVESERDSAVAVIESLKRQFPAMPCRVVVAGVADHCGQKVHNLAVATRRVLDVAPPE